MSDCRFGVSPVNYPNPELSVCLSRVCACVRAFLRAGMHACMYICMAG